MEDKILFETEVGSFMWGMGTKESDRDVMQIYMQSPRDILSGYNLTKNKPQRQFKQHGWEWDYQHMEIGHLVNLLIKGNVNAIWATMSPVILNDYTKDLLGLRELAAENLSKASYHSIHGMAISNVNDNVKRPNMPKNKAYKQALRTIMFGINMFKYGDIKFVPVTFEVTKEDVDLALIELEESHTKSTLPNVPNEQKFRDYLYALRRKEIS